MWILRHPSSEASCDWNAAAADATLPLVCPCCSDCRASLAKSPLRLSPVALANNALCVPPPPELQGLSLGEQMFVARGFPLRRLRTMTTSGDPQSRQKGLLGTASAIAFPQDSTSVLRVLPTAAHQLVDYLSIFFTGASSAGLRSSKEFLVRRTVVETALRWLITHNAYYADVQLDHAALESLPQHGIPEAWLGAAQATTHSVERELGPVDASSASGLSSPAIHAAVLEPATLPTDPLRSWLLRFLPANAFIRKRMLRQTS